MRFTNKGQKTELLCDGQSPEDAILTQTVETEYGYYHNKQLEKCLHHLQYASQFLYNITTHSTFL